MDELSQYEKIKKWCREHKKEIQVGVCFVLMFFVGFGTGRYDKESQKSKAKSQKYNNTNQVSQQKAEAVGDNQTDANKVQVAGQTATGGEGDMAKAGDANCVIKGNISSTGKMLYHMPTGAFYKNTNPEKCFNTEAEAKAAGFRKSSR